MGRAKPCKGEAFRERSRSRWWHWQGEALHRAWRSLVSIEYLPGVQRQNNPDAIIDIEVRGTMQNARVLHGLLARNPLVLPSRGRHLTGKIVALGDHVIIGVATVDVIQKAFATPAAHARSPPTLGGSQPRL